MTKLIGKNWATNNINVDIPNDLKINNLIKREILECTFGAGATAGVANLKHLLSRFSFDVKPSCTGLVSERFLSGMINAIDTIGDRFPGFEDSKFGCATEWADEFIYLALYDVRNSGDDLPMVSETKTEEIEDWKKNSALFKKELEEAELKLDAIKAIAKLGEDPFSRKLEAIKTICSI